MLKKQMLPPQGKGLDGIQALRFMAAMLVVALHAVEALVSHGEKISLWNGGSIGVDIFFVISGFVMALTTAHHPQGWRARGNAALSFCRRRLTRLLPLYWFYTLLKLFSVILLPTLVIRTTLVPWHVVASFLLIPVMAPWGQVQPVLPVGWTLCLELFFYAIFALAILLAAPRLLFCLSVFLLVSLLHRWMPDVVALAFYQHIMVYDFALGIFIAWAWKKSAGIPIIFPVLALFPALFSIIGMFDVTAGQLYIVHGLSAGALVWGVAVLEPAWQKCRFLAWARHLGDASYSTYLSHAFVVPVTVMLAIDYWSPAVTLPLVLAVCALAGSVSFRFIEKPMIDVFHSGYRRAAVRAGSS